MIITNTKDTLTITFGPIPTNPADITLSADAGLSIANKSCTSATLYAVFISTMMYKCYYDPEHTQLVYLDEAKTLLQQGQVAIVTEDGNIHFGDKFDGSLGYIGQTSPDMPSFDIMFRCSSRD